MMMIWKWADKWEYCKWGIRKSIKLESSTIFLLHEFDWTPKIELNINFNQAVKVNSHLKSISYLRREREKLNWNHRDIHKNYSRMKIRIIFVTMISTTTAFISTTPSEMSIDSTTNNTADMPDIMVIGENMSDKSSRKIHITDAIIRSDF